MCRDDDVNEMRTEGKNGEPPIIWYDPSDEDDYDILDDSYFDEDDIKGMRKWNQTFL
jgi:hypothetical protein